MKKDFTLMTIFNRTLKNRTLVYNKSISIHQEIQLDAKVKAPMRFSTGSHVQLVYKTFELL